MDAFIRILVEDILVFAYCDDQIDEDFSIKQLERITADVSAAGTAEVERFRSVVRTMADEARASCQAERAESLDALPGDMGLDE